MKFADILIVIEQIHLYNIALGLEGRRERGRERRKKKKNIYIYVYI